MHGKTDSVGSRGERGRGDGGGKEGWERRRREMRRLGAVEIHGKTGQRPDIGFRNENGMRMHRRGRGDEKKSSANHEQSIDNT